MHGDQILQAVNHLSQQVGLSLDGECNEEGNGQGTTTRKLYTNSNQPRQLAPAKFEAWKMWHEDGLSIQKIAVSNLFFPINLTYNFESIKSVGNAEWNLEF